MNYLNKNKKNLISERYQLLYDYAILQGLATYGPRAGRGPPRHFTWPATFFLLAMIDMQQQTAEMILIPRRNLFLLSSPPIRPRKGLNFRQGPFFVFATDSSEKRPEFLVKTFFFWSAEMVSAGWNLVRTECGPLVQKGYRPLQ